MTHLHGKQKIWECKNTQIKKEENSFSVQCNQF